MNFINQLKESQFIMPALAFIFAFAITYISIPSIIQVAKIKHLFDEPDSRKLHKSKVPTLGGLAIFAGASIAALLFCDFTKMADLQYLMAAMIILFFIGIKDDIVILSATTKFIGQFLAAIVLVWLGNIRLTSFGGVFGIYNLNYEFSVIFSILTIVVIVNSFNLIDGIDGLAGTISFIVISAYAAWFYNVGAVANQLFVFSVAVMGGLLGFLRFNITPARIFMGDTGSLLMGTIIAVLTLEFINLNHNNDTIHRLHTAPVLAFGILIIPLYDLLRVFTVRIIRKKSPFHPDKIHVHHKLLQLGMSHLQATFTLGFINVLFIIFIFIFQDYNVTLLMVAILLLATLFTILLWSLNKLKIRKNVEN